MFYPNDAGAFAVLPSISGIDYGGRIGLELINHCLERSDNRGLICRSPFRVQKGFPDDGADRVGRKIRYFCNPPNVQLVVLGVCELDVEVSSPVLDYFQRV